MPRLIFKCPYVKGGSQRAAAHLSNYVRYMATREGGAEALAGPVLAPCHGKAAGVSGAAPPGLPPQPRDFRV